MKKLVSIVLALALVLACCSVAFAAEKITIKSNAPAGSTNSTTYSWYRVLKADYDGNLAAVDQETGSWTTAGTAVSYYVESETLATEINKTSVLKATKAPGANRWNVEIVGTPTAEAIATALNTDAIKNAIASTDKGSVDAVSNNDVVINTPGKGYYLIVADNGSKLVAQTLGDVTIKEKNKYITDVKVVDKADVAVGDEVTYTVTVHVPSTAVVGEYIHVHDTMDSRLQLVAAPSKATYNSKEIDLVTGTKKNDTETFAVKFAIAEDMLDKDVVMTYKATVLDTAVADTGFINDSFANDSNFETLPSKVKVYTFNFKLDKTFTGATGNAEDFIATFELSQGSTVFKFDVDANDATKYTQDPTGSVSVITVNKDQVIDIKGLKAGEYVLTEKSTASGYNMLTEPILVKITDLTPDSKNAPEQNVAHKVEFKLQSATEWSTAPNFIVEVVNNQGTQLPSTGGIGTTIFYILGGLLVVGAAVILVARRKASN